MFRTDQIIRPLDLTSIMVTCWKKMKGNFPPRRFIYLFVSNRAFWDVSLHWLRGSIFNSIITALQVKLQKIKKKINWTKHKKVHEWKGQEYKYTYGFVRVYVSGGVETGFNPKQDLDCCVKSCRHPLQPLFMWKSPENISAEEQQSGGR